MRTTIEAMAATQGHTQSLHTNALDEALALPTDFSARIARNTQLFLQQESGTTRIIDPWGGSYYVERLTRDLAAKAWGHIQEVEALGGMAKAIEAGVPKLRIEEASAKTQARIDAGKQAVIGVNKYKPVDEAPIDVLKVENSTVRRLQIDKLKRLRPALITTFSPSTASDTDSFSGSARRMSKNFRPGTVMSPASCTATSVEATNSTSKSVAVIHNCPCRTPSNTLARTGMVWRRSTTPITACSGASNFSRSAVNFMGTPVYQS